MRYLPTRKERILFILAVMFGCVPAFLCSIIYLASLKAQEEVSLAKKTESYLLKTSTPISKLEPTNSNTNTPLPTNTPTQLFTPTPLLNIIEAKTILVENGFMVIDIQIRDTEAEVILELNSQETTEDIELITQPLKRLYRAELNIYTSIYLLFDQYKELSNLVIQVNLDAKPIYRVSVSRDRAYFFYPGLFSKPVTQLDWGMLATSALLDRKINDYEHAELIDSEIISALTTPDVNNIKIELGKWMDLDEINNVWIDGNIAYIDLDLDWYVDFFSALEPSLREEQIKLQAGLFTVDSFYSLFTRFSWIDQVRVRTMISGNAYSSYQINRQDFYSIGAHKFNRAADRGKPDEVLILLPK